MHIGKVWAAYFSATGTTQKVVMRIADALAAALEVERADYDFTLPGARSGPMRFGGKDLVIFGTPVYAGRVPNVLLKYLATIEGNGALAIPVSLYGNRNYDNALIELRNILIHQGLYPVTAGAFVGEHSFSTILGAARPDAQDMAIIDAFAADSADKICELPEDFVPALIEVKGDPEAGYYKPKGKDGNPIDIRKVRPLVAAHCTDCKICAEVCPMGSIDHADVRLFEGVCIKCGACIKKCPVQARYYEDPDYLFHKQDLEETYTRRADPEVFV